MPMSTFEMLNANGARWGGVKDYNMLCHASGLESVAISPQGTLSGKWASLQVVGEPQTY